MIVGIIYLYISPSGKPYIGQTINEVNRRKSWFDLKVPYTKWKSKIDNARLKYGPENFTYKVLFKDYYTTKIEAKQYLNKIETYYIGVYNSFKCGYNCTLGGDAISGYIHTEETKRKLSKIHKGKKLSKAQIEFLKSINTGRKHTEDTKRKIGLSHKGMKYSEEQRTNISKALTGRKLSKSAKINISKGHKGIKQDTEWVSKRVTKCHKHIGAFDGDGNLIIEFASLKDAASSIKRSPSTLSVICKNNKFAYGYFWKYIL